MENCNKSIHLSMTATRQPCVKLQPGLFITALCTICFTLWKGLYSQLQRDKVLYILDMRVELSVIVCRWCISVHPNVQSLFLFCKSALYFHCLHMNAYSDFVSSLIKPKFSFLIKKNANHGDLLNSYITIFILYIDWVILLRQAVKNVFSNLHNSSIVSFLKHCR